MREDVVIKALVPFTGLEKGLWTHLGWAQDKKGTEDEQAGLTSWDSLGNYNDASAGKGSLHCFNLVFQ
jgi:hypothetical protein